MYVIIINMIISSSHRQFVNSNNESIEDGSLRWWANVLIIASFLTRKKYSFNRINYQNIEFKCAW